MSLDVYVRRGHSLRHTGEPQLAIENDGAFWYLEPFFAKVRAKTGELIDLYGDASFQGAALVSLSDELAHAEVCLASKPNSWSYGESFHPKSGTSSSNVVTKVHVAGVLQNLRSIVHEALESHAVLDFVGD